MVGILLAAGCLGILPVPIGLAVLAGGAGLVLAASRPVWAIAMVLAAIPLELFVFELGPVGIAPVQVVAILVMAMMVAEMLATGRFEIPRTALDVPIFVWLAVGFIGAIGAIDAAAAIKKAGMAVVFAAVYYLVTARVRRMRSVSVVLKTLVAACTVVGAYGIWVSYAYIATGTVTGRAITVGSEGLALPRAGSTVGDPSLLAALMVVALPIGMTLVVLAKGWKRLAAVIASAIMLGALGFTFTRGAWLGGAAALLVLVFDSRSRRLIIVTAIALALLIPPSIVARAVSSADTGRYEIAHRFDYWKASLLMFESRPVFGVGINNFYVNFVRLKVPGTAQRIPVQSHNIVLALLCETGVVGLLAYGSIIGGALLMVLRRRRSDPSAEGRLWRLAIAASIVGSLVHGMTDSFLLPPSFNAITWVLIGLAVVFDAGVLQDDGVAGTREGLVT